MTHAASCATDFLFDPGVDQNAVFHRLTPLVETALGQGCELFAPSSLWDAAGCAGSILNFETVVEFKEVRDILYKWLPRLTLVDAPECEGRATPGTCLTLSLVTLPPAAQNCGENHVVVTFAVNESDYQFYWRHLLGTVARTSGEFDLVLKSAFLALEFGPEGRGRWHRTGYDLRNVRQVLVEHLSYLNDDAIKDWEESRFIDSEFAKRARVRLSRDEDDPGGRQFPDDWGVQHHCRHHTKLNAEGAGKSAYYGGRIYFEIEQRANVFVGRFAEHE